MTRRSAALLGAAACGAAAAGCYLNARSAEFAFDDHFAITYSGDVTDPNKPLAAIWRNDFWGQDIRGEGSHKSWRCARLVVVLLRSSRRLRARVRVSRWLAPLRVRDAALRARHRPLTVLTFRLNRVLSADPSKVTPRPFHATNVVLHAGAAFALPRRGPGGQRGDAG